MEDKEEVSVLKQLTTSWKEDTLVFSLFASQRQGCTKHGNKSPQKPG